VTSLTAERIDACRLCGDSGFWPLQPAAPKLYLGSMGLQGGMVGVYIDDVAVGSTPIGCN
jgi:hypothetical protein